MAEEREFHLTEPTIVCPKCGVEIKLTESLAAPLLEATRREYEERSKKKDSEFEQREVLLRQGEHELCQEKESLEQRLTARLQEERKRIVDEEAAKAKSEITAVLDEKDKELLQAQDLLRDWEVKLREAQKTQAEFMRKERELDDARRELDLTIEKSVQAQLSGARSQARREAEDQLQLKVMEKEQTITSMQKQIEELKRRAEQGSQQLQGEVQELQLEALLASQFPIDTIEPVAKGDHGGDVLQRVSNSIGGSCGTILWETKRTKNWSDGWLVKLREDQRACKADVAILLSHALPAGMESFDLIEGVWVSHPRVAIPVATSIRQFMIEIAGARQSAEGQQTKATLVYQYLTGQRFRLRVQAIVEAFSSMQEDLDKEKRAIVKQWAKREEQIERVMHATVGMYGDLQGIAGKTIQEIEGLSMETLSSDDATQSLEQ